MQKKVSNAIILAAGMSTRFVPFSYEYPKGLVVVRDEVLIERQIRQLKEAGVNNIVVVTGYMFEKFLYLEEKFGVKIIVNPEYKYKNSFSSLYYAREYLTNTYVCSSDNYYTTNPFVEYEDNSYFSSVYKEEASGERGLICNDDELIIDTQKPSPGNQYVVLGFAFLNEEFNKTFIPLLEKYYNTAGHENYFWESIYHENLKILKMYRKKFSDGEIFEFDSIEELRIFDENSITSNASKAVDNIVSVMNVTNVHEIKFLYPLKGGMTNKSFAFSINDKKYVYRHPGNNSFNFINRKTEQKSNIVANRLGVDKTFIYEDVDDGWKISEFIESDNVFDSTNPEHIKILSNTLHKFHDVNIDFEWKFDFYLESQKILGLIKKLDMNTYDFLMEFEPEIYNVYKDIEKDSWPKIFVHNDITSSNIIFHNNEIDIIDWEYSAKNEIGYDICKLFAMDSTDVDYDRIDMALSIYYGRKPTNKEIIHLIGCTIVCSYYWLVRATYLEILGEDLSSLILSHNKRIRSYLTEYYKKAEIND